MRSWIVLWILLVSDSDATFQASNFFSECAIGKYYANGVMIPDVEKKEVNGTMRCVLTIEITVICDVKTATIIGGVQPQADSRERCSSIPNKEDTIFCGCKGNSNCNYKEDGIREILESSHLSPDIKRCAIKVVQKAFYATRVTTNATLDNATTTAISAAKTTTAPSTPSPSQNGHKLDFKETFGRFRPQDEEKPKYQKKYRSFKQRYNLIYIYCFLLMTLIIIWQIRRYLVDRYDLQSDLSLWFEKKKQHEMLWVERFRESNRAYRREYTKAGEEYWTAVKKREKEAQKKRMAEWKDRYEGSGECARVEGAGILREKDYSPAAIERRAHEWAVREERVTYFTRQADSDFTAAIEARKKAQEEDNRQRDLLLGNIAMSAETAAIMRRRRRRNKKRSAVDDEKNKDTLNDK